MLWSLTAIALLAICCLWSRIRLAIQVIQATADFITDYQLVLLVPIINIVILLLFILYWLYSGAYIFSVGTPEYVEGRNYARVKWNGTTRTYWYVHLFSLLWNIGFITYLSHFVIIVVAATWYFA